ncbi:uncharacterized protein LOC9654877 isoform X2 [Selaginella moellendorffii]|uniref:uncharacterized protein LOC9654877 isoform X2 n=1 Tax=Selaginella moellendorffii TaxID=88036 RepID=UPI000D1C7EDE|nr:uncharacterized protein LOC9654877 isoform X2 [Selaginella moellendorffii]|eukprot:XP_024524751.1 uncharacterized protein LOC9654877 isoform X2 [Selaginella moellendorffii]
MHIHDQWATSMARALILLPAPRCRLLSRASLRKGGKFIVTTDKRVINVSELGALLAATGQNCHQFPQIAGDGRVSRVDDAKLQRALDFSDIAVAIYVKGRSIPGGDYMERTWSEAREGVWDRLNSDKAPKCLVAFGRAVSDKTLAGSIHDLAVAPSMQRQGLGRHVLQRLARYMYYTLDIADISVLTRPENMPFFASCGFKPDALCSTSMLYTKTPPVNSKTYHEATRAGKMTLLVPAPSVKASFTAF